MFYYIQPMSESTYLLGKQTAAAERATGSHVVVMRDAPPEYVLGMAEGVRLFTNGLSGCVGIGYTALLSRGRRAAYLQHAFYGDVCNELVRAQPLAARTGRIHEASGVLMVRSYMPLAPVTADKQVPYEAFSTQETLAPLVNDLVEACGDEPAAVTIVPYYEGSADDQPYARSLAVHVPAWCPGTIFAEGRPVGEPRPCADI